MKDLSTLNLQELEDFFNSFDHVLTDVDGVLWNVQADVPGAKEALSSLERLNKQVILVSNNSAISSEAIEARLKESGYRLKKINYVTPATAVVSYLKKQNFKDRSIFVIGMSPLRKALQDAGFTLAQNGPDHVRESITEYAALCIADDASVGAVVADVDVNLNSLNMQKALTFLRREDVLFLSGATDEKYPLGGGRFLVGPGAFVSILEKMSGRRAVAMAKPGRSLHDCIVEEFKIGDASRVLFVGDSVLQDMGFATKCGYRKLLVFSGLEGRSCVEKWEFGEELRPDFYAQSLKTVHEAVVRVFGKGM